ncbi:MAG: hypothetical protein HY925_14690 [Elusimicrobia bacterium]|nr:hypothetical protein [Elusimicrobiota bacterium]
MSLMTSRLLAMSLVLTAFQWATAGGYERAQSYAAALTGSAPNQQQNPPLLPAGRELKASPSAAAQAAPLATLAQVVRTFGFDEDLSGALCTALGVTQNNRDLRVKQIDIPFNKDGSIGKLINIWTPAGQTTARLIMADYNQTRVYLYNTDLGAELTSAVLGHKGVNPTPLTKTEALAGFNTEVAWWLAKERELREKPPVKP